MRPIATVAFTLTAILGGCGADDSGQASADADPSQCGPANASADAMAHPLAAEFLRVEGEDFESCFPEMPRLDGPGERLDFAGPQGASGPGATNRVVVAIDASGSMAGRAGGETKMSAAKAAVSRFLRDVPEGSEVGLVAFGHRGTNADAGRAESCRGVETVYSLGSADVPRIDQAMRRFNATGWTPLAAAITQAGSSFTPSDTPGAQVVYVVSDGIETCGGDPVAAARALHGGEVKAIVNVIGFDLAPADRAQLRAVAEAGGGQFIEAETGADLRRVAAAEMARRRENLLALNQVTGEANRTIGRNDLNVNLPIGQMWACLNPRFYRESYGLDTARAGPQFDSVQFRSVPGLADWHRARLESYKTRARQTQARLESARADTNSAIRQQQNDTRERFENSEN